MGYSTDDLILYGAAVSANSVADVVGSSPPSARRKSFSVADGHGGYCRTVHGERSKGDISHHSIRSQIHPDPELELAPLSANVSFASATMGSIRANVMLCDLGIWRGTQFRAFRLLHVFKQAILLRTCTRIIHILFNTASNLTTAFVTAAKLVWWKHGSEPCTNLVPMLQSNRSDDWVRNGKA